MRDVPFVRFRGSCAAATFVIGVFSSNALPTQAHEFPHCSEVATSYPTSRATFDEGHSPRKCGDGGVSVKLIARVGKSPVDESVSDFVYKVQVSNGSKALPRAVARLVGTGEGTRAVDGFVQVGDLSRWEKANPDDTITIRHDRSFRMDRAELVWSVSSLDDPSVPQIRDVPQTNLIVSQADCTADKLGSIAKRDILEPVSGVSLDPPVWVPAAGSNPAYCEVTGTIAPVDTTATNIDIRFRVALPSSWAYRAVQVGGGGNNGSIPSMTGGGHLARGWVVLGSDSGHQDPDDTWTLHDEALKNFGYMQLKKTHDAAWVLIERMYGHKPIYSYFIGNSQGGREALTVVQRRTRCDQLCPVPIVVGRAHARGIAIPKPRCRSPRLCRRQQSLGAEAQAGVRVARLDEPRPGAFLRARWPPHCPERRGRFSRIGRGATRLLSVSAR